MTNASKTRLILPCAGFGKRMSMSPDKSKELLIYEGIPLIQWHLDIAAKYDLVPLVVTRKEKTDLIDYCKERNIETQIIEVTGEWPDTILKSEPFWHENNILMLPDTRFSPISIVQDLNNYLQNHDFSIAVHMVDDVSKWGYVSSGDQILYEKPPKVWPGDAWGIIGFKKQVGANLFTACRLKLGFMLTSAKIIGLDSFKDLTRTGILE